MSDIKPINLIAQIIQTRMNLATGQVMIANQKYMIPKTPGLYVVLSYLGGKPIGNNNYQIPSTDGMQDITEVTMQETIQIDIMSSNAEARERKEEVIAALNSYESQRVCEANAMQLARNTSGLIDVSMVEGSAQLTRYTTTIAVLALFRTTSPVGEYYEDFTRAVPPEIVTNS